jgi:hypothetical protein
MRRRYAILGTIFTAAMLINISGIVQAWTYADHVEYGVGGTVNCTNPDYAVGAPNEQFASVGIDVPPTRGNLVLDLGSNSSYWIVTGAGDDFTVFANSTTQETYWVYVWHPDKSVENFIGWGNDTQDYSFDIPVDDGEEYRYVQIWPYTADTAKDPAYGPDIDAVGWP